MAPKAKAPLRAAAGRAAGKSAAARPAGKAAPKAAPKAVPKAAGKRKAEEQAAPPAKKGVAARPAGPAKRGGGGGRKVDSRCPKQDSKVCEDYSVTLNQTNVDANNNKFYLIQVLEGNDGKFYAWNRWGRVGDPGQFKLMPCANKEMAIKEFKSKFRSKSCNAWENKGSFKAVKGKYTLVETEEAGGDAQAPMGKLSQQQVGKGQGVLDKLEVALSKKKADQVREFSSEFYSLIPHNFGWKKPVAIDTQPLLAEKVELLKFFMRMGFEQIESDTGATPIDGLMKLPLPKSLDEAATGCCGKKDVDGSNKKGKDLAAKQAGKPTRAMGASLYAAIMLYTSNAIYADLNKALRNKDRAKIKKYFKYLRLLFEAMSALPRRATTLWRGLGVDLSSNAEYAVGSTVTWWGVSSCTSEQKVARGFADSCGGGSSFITVKASTSCDISAISFFSNEKESLLRPGTKLKVESRTKKGSVCEIVLKEVGNAIQ